MSRSTRSFETRSRILSSRSKMREVWTSPRFPLTTLPILFFNRTIVDAPKHTLHYGVGIEGDFRPNFNHHTVFGAGLDTTEVIQLEDWNIKMVHLNPHCHPLFRRRRVLRSKTFSLLFNIRGRLRGGLSSTPVFVSICTMILPPSSLRVLAFSWSRSPILLLKNSLWTCFSCAKCSRMVGSTHTG